MAKTNTAETEEKNETGDAPLIDLNEASLKKLISRAKKRGYITYDELNDALPQDQMSSEQIEDVMSALSEMGVNIVENEEADEDARAGAGQRRRRGRSGGGRDLRRREEEGNGRPHRRSGAHVPARDGRGGIALSREGEIAIAKRIEAGRDTMIWGLCESPITFNAIIEWSNALNNGMMQLREILDLEAMLSKGPTAEQVEGAEADDDTISESTAGPSLQGGGRGRGGPAEEEDEEDSLVERRAPRPVEEEDEDNTLSLAQMEETLKPAALDKFAAITDLYKKFAKLQAHADGRDERAARNSPPADEQQISEAARAAHRRGGERPVPRRQDRISGRPALQLQPPADRHWAGRCCASPSATRCRASAFLDAYMGHELDEGWAERVCGIDKKWTAFCDAEADADRAHPHRDQRDQPGDRHEPRRVPPDREPGPERRARGADRQEGDGRGEPAPRHLDRQEIHQSRPAIPRPDPGGQYRPDEGGRQVRISPRLQILDLRDLVDPPGDHPLASPTRRAPSASRST